MNKKIYHKPMIFYVNAKKNEESIQLAGACPRAVIFLKSKLVNQK